MFVGKRKDFVLGAVQKVISAPEQYVKVLSMFITCSSVLLSFFVSYMKTYILMFYIIFYIMYKFVVCVR